MQRTVRRPAYQPFEAQERAVGQIHDRLEEGGEIALFDYVLKCFHGGKSRGWNCGAG
jgi:hypothetical protein